MAKTLLSDWLHLQLERDSAEPLYRQLFRLLQRAILSRELPANARLPSSRLLAAELGIARNTVTQVYEQLAVEGYVVSRGGSGTFVADSGPDEIVGAAPPRPVVTAAPTLSARGRRLIDTAGVASRQLGAFMPGVPDMTAFPGRVWSRLQNKYWRRTRPDLMTYAPGGGYRPLREALATYLRTARSVNCAPEQIVITAGIHQSIDLAVRLLADGGDRAWVEEPCYWGIRSVLQSGGLTLEPVPVDAEGMDPGGRGSHGAPRLILVTPSHQYPLGVVMSLARRRTLLEYARRHGSWIVEDDYDSEFRYGSRPLACLQGLDSAGRVLYAGSFSKTLFPGLRIGYLVVPEALAPAFATGSAELYREGQMLTQAVLADFIAEGHLSSHIRRMRGLYRERRRVLMEAIASRFGDRLPIMGDNAGLHLVIALPAGTDDRAVAEAALARGVAVRPLSNYYTEPGRAQAGLLLGYGGVPVEGIAPAFAILGDIIEETLGAAAVERS